MTAPAVSVIVAVRDAAATLAAAIESVVSQNVPSPWRAPEVIVIDGGSSDGSDRIASGHPAVRLVRQAGRGLAAARNEAVRAARAPILAFCDADDRWTPGSLAVRLRAIEAEPEAQAVVGKLVLVAAAGGQPTPGQQSLLGIPRVGFTPGCLLARRDVFDRVGWFDESLRIGADSDWFVRLRESRLPVATVDATVLLKAARGTSLSTDVATYRRELLDVGRRFIRNRRQERPT
jgi:glycosyltransferase involved in cell wall biosynthesis